MGFLPHSETMLQAHQTKSNIPKLKTRTLRRHDRFRSANGKANHARSKQTFLFQRHLYMFHFKKSFHFEHIPSNTYLIIYNKSNTKLHYSSVFTLFWKEIQLILTRLHHAATTSLTSELREHVLQRTPVRRHNLIALTTVQRPRKKLCEVPSQK